MQEKHPDTSKRSEYFFRSCVKTKKSILISSTSYLISFYELYFYDSAAKNREMYPSRIHRLSSGFSRIGDVCSTDVTIPR